MVKFTIIVTELLPGEQRGPTKRDPKKRRVEVNVGGDFKNRTKAEKAMADRVWNYLGGMRKEIIHGLD